MYSVECRLYTSVYVFLYIFMKYVLDVAAD